MLGGGGYRGWRDATDPEADEVVYGARSSTHHSLPIVLRSYEYPKVTKITHSLHIMWLDRFSGHSTPAESPPPHSRNYSPAPAPRRTSHLAPGQRSGLGLTAGGSSLSLGLSSNGSNVSLPTTSRMPNGSSLRQEHRPSPNVPDPLNILRSILGISEEGAQNTDENKSLIEKPREVKADIDFGGLSLEDYAKDEDQQPGPGSAFVPHQFNSVDEREKYRHLHDSIEGCDEVLKSVESYLTNFQNELGIVSAEIESLQTRSTQLNAKLENRRKVEKLLGPAVEEISISPITVRTISEGPVDENWIRALDEIESRSATIGKKTSGSIKAIEDVRPLLEDLNVKAVERIRDFIVAQIKALRSPNINAQIIQQQTFIKYKDLYVFLARHNSVLAEEVGQAYVNTMKWYYTSNFTRYQQSLEKLPLHIIEQNEVLGGDPSPRRNVLAATKTPAPQHDAFSLGRRSDVLKTKSKDAISSYLAEEDKTHHFLEASFYNFNLALIDNICFEYSVVTELFSKKTFHEVSRKVIEMFEPSFSLGQTLTKQLIETNTDCLGVLLCVRINQHFAFELQRRKVPVADSYINGINMLLWPRFQIIMDLHCESLKRVTASTNRGAVATFSLVGNDTSKTSVAPHPVTQKFGQFLHGILALSSDAGDDEPVANSLGRLRGEYEGLMLRLAKGAGDASKRSRFLYYNYSLVLTIISDTQGKLGEEQKAHFEELMKQGRDRR
jgi:vacuolar protein sorting-associated protein 52